MTRLSRRRFLVDAGRLSVASAIPAVVPSILAGCRGSTPSHDRPNVLFIYADDLRPELGCYGSTRMRSPNIDRLAGWGTLFERSYCQFAMCGPSRASMITGQRPDTLGVGGQKAFYRETAPQVVTLPQHFKAHGYRSLAVGKVHHARRLDPQSWSEPAWFPTEKRQFYVLPENLRMKESVGAGPPFELADREDEAYSDFAIASKAIEILRQPTDSPLFLAVGFYKPHLPFIAPRRFAELFPLDQVPLSPNPERPRAAPDIAYRYRSEIWGFEGMPSDGPPVPEDLARELLRAYYAAVSFMDSQVGRVIDALEDLSLRERTVVVFWGDHGIHLGDAAFWGKNTLFEAGLHTPLLIAAPGRGGEGARAGGLVEAVDLYPTLAELCGLPAPTDVEGDSLVPLLDDPSRAWKAAAFGQCVRGLEGVRGRTLRDPDYRYSEWHARDGSVMARELYALASDPHERVNVVADPGHVDARMRLEELLRRGWRAARPRA
jgi:arylsulfatase A-like enzyme